MITYLQILDAVNTVNGHRPGDFDGPTVRQLTLSLQVYKERGTFNGTIDSAKECLRLAGYELYDDDEYFIQIARDRHGNAVRDNTRDQLIAIGRAIENGDDE